METLKFVTDASDADFQEKVLLRSQEVPVLLDCWATWCGPCKTIGPILEGLAAEYEGRFELVKVDIDRAPQIAMALRIQSVPTVYLFKGGQPVDGFQGAQPESAIRALLDKHIPAVEASPFDIAQQAMAEGNSELAAQQFRVVLETEPDNGDALIAMAKLALGQGDESAAGGWLDRVAADNPARGRADKLRSVIGFSKDCGELGSLRQIVAADATNVEAWYQLGATLAVAGETENAMDAFLEVVKRDRSFRDDGGRLALIALFEAVGMDDELVVKYRRRLAAFLF
ncbi:MAG: thioredoxin [Bradymonadia bacterium]